MPGTLLNWAGSSASFDLYQRITLADGIFLPAASSANIPERVQPRRKFIDPVIAYIARSRRTMWCRCGPTLERGWLAAARSAAASATSASSSAWPRWGLGSPVFCPAKAPSEGKERHSSSGSSRTLAMAERRVESQVQPSRSITSLFVVLSRRASSTRCNGLRGVMASPLAVGSSPLARRRVLPRSSAR